jgi:SulP family sulfate permease
MVSLNTFEWASLRTLRKMPVSEAITMIATVIIVLATDDLALGVLVGVVMSALVFGWRIAHIRSTVSIGMRGEKHYVISGQMFFGTMNHFIDLFDFNSDPDEVMIDFSHSHVWDHSAVTGINKVIQIYEGLDKSVSLIGLNEESKKIIHRSGLPFLRNVVGI